jgi:hypothetical protein
MYDMAGKPNVNSSGQKELDKAEKQFDEFKENIDSMTLDRMNQAKPIEQEPQTKLSQADLARSNQIYLKPKRTQPSREKFNEEFRDQYNFAKEYVNFIAENKELIGESIELWTKPFPGVPAEEWVVPTNKPIWGPRYLAEQIHRCSYHRFSMQQQATGTDGMGQYFGAMVVDNTIQRLDASLASSRKSIFMGSSSF